MASPVTSTMTGRPWRPACCAAVLALLVAAAPSKASQQPAPAGADTALVERLRSDPDDLEVLESLGKVRLDRGDFRGALDCYEVLLRRRPGVDRLRLARARCHAGLGMIERARLTAKEVLVAAPDNEEAAALLRQTGVAVGPLTRIDDRADLVRICEREHCLGRQELVRRGLAAYNTEKGVAVYLTAHNQRCVVEALARYGYTDRAYPEPTGAGEYRSTAAGAFWCTLHGGSRRAGEIPANRLPRLGRVVLEPAMVDRLLSAPTPSLVVALADQAAKRGRATLAEKLIPALGSIREVSDLALALRDLALATRDLAAVDRVNGPGSDAVFAPLLAHSDAEIRELGTILKLRVRGTVSVTPELAVGLVRRAGRGELARDELSRILAFADERTSKRLAGLVAGMDMAQARAAIPGLARTRDPSVLLELARRLPEYLESCPPAAASLVRALREATGADCGQDAPRWLAALAKMPRPR